jgi:phosphate starvation-inducible PhoH-like protein
LPSSQLDGRSSTRTSSQSNGESSESGNQDNGPRAGFCGDPELRTRCGGAQEIRDRLVFDDAALSPQLFGQHNQNLKRIEQELGLALHCRGGEVTMVGDAESVAIARLLLEQLAAMLRRGTVLDVEDVARAARVLRADRRAELRDIFTDTVLVSARARPITPKGLAQKRYVDAIRRRDFVFGIGPAGTGKTYLAMAIAVRELMDRQVKRIILTRPAVEAGEKLGFLPGSMAEKVNPYLRPLYDALNDMIDLDRAQQLIDRGLIEVAPLAFMRGRTLNDSFVILDEAQNTTSEQMKMFLTRLGFDSKAVITGDVTQIDLPEGKRSGLMEARELLEGIDEIAFCYFTDADVVRHPLVARIIRAYECRDAQRQARVRRPEGGDLTGLEAGGAGRAEPAAGRGAEPGGESGEWP